jgi:dTDP-4-dehydrorhamnose 3,5-epimerase
MKFLPTRFPEAWLVQLNPHEDDRGWFARTYCEETFAKHGINSAWPQHNQTLTRRRGMIRGLHWQEGTPPEIKLVRCISGCIWDVIVDIRPDSSTFGHWQAFELSQENQRQLYVPAGFAHGFQCLTDNAQVFYLMSTPYVPGQARGIRWNDPTVSVAWPLPLQPPLSDRDNQLPFLKEPV